MGRGLRPIVLGGYVGLILTLLGAQLGGMPWLLAGILSTVRRHAARLLRLERAAERRRGGSRSRCSASSGSVVGSRTFMLVRDIPATGACVVFTVLITVFADDTAAFFVGRAIGRHRLAPAISPGKSWEGFVGGTIAGVAVAFFALYEQDVLSTWESLVLGLVIALAATLGDLFESAVKRDLGVKDSGRLLGGHGGVLDRVDSLLWAGPAAYFALLALA